MRANAFSERGFGLISAVFLLVILAALGAAVVNVSTMQHSGAAMEVQAARARQAAQAGIEWGLYQALAASSCVGTPKSFAPPAPALSSFTVTVTCASTTTTNTAPLITVRQIKAIACNQPAGGHCPPNDSDKAMDYVERVVQITF